MQRWRRVLFSNESRFVFYTLRWASPGFRRRGINVIPITVCWTVTCLVKKKIVMVWCRICNSQNSRLVITKGNFKAQRYIDSVLQLVVVPYVHQYSLFFMTRRALYNRHQNDIKTLHWPSYRPDFAKRTCGTHSNASKSTKRTNRFASGTPGKVIEHPYGTN